MATRWEWFRENEAKLYVRRRFKYVMERSLQDMVARARELLSVPVGIGEGGEIERSAPGEPPRMETGWLQASVRYEIVDDKSGWVGTDLDYGWYLEMGTKRGIAPRPWLRPAMATVWQKLGEYVKALGD